LTPSKTASLQAALLESFAATARAEVVASEFLFQQFAAAHDPYAAFNARFGREALAPFAHRLEKMAVR